MEEEAPLDFAPSRLARVFALKEKRQQMKKLLQKYVPLEHCQDSLVVVVGGQIDILAFDNLIQIYILCWAPEDSIIFQR